MTSDEPMFDDNVQFFFNEAFKQSVDAIATVLEKPEFSEPRIQNLVMLELIGHIALSMHRGAKSVGSELEEAAVETLTRYFAFLTQLLHNGGLEQLAGKAEQRIN